MLCNCKLTVKVYGNGGPLGLGTVCRLRSGGSRSNDMAALECHPMQQYVLQRSNHTDCNSKVVGKVLNASVYCAAEHKQPLLLGSLRRIRLTYSPF